MAVSYTKEYKDRKKLEYKINVRQGIFITDYVKTKYSKIFQEAAELYNTISSKYPCKPNLLKTYQYRKWKNEILTENHRPTRHVPKQRDRYYQTTHYPQISAAENDNDSFNNTTSQTMQFTLEIPLLNRSEINITPPKPNESDRHNHQTEPPPQQDDVVNHNPGTPQTQCIQEGNQADPNLDNSVFDGVPDYVVEQIISDLRRDPLLARTMDDIEKVIEEGTTGLETGLQDPFELDIGVPDLQDPFELDVDVPDLQDPLQEEIENLST